MRESHPLWFIVLALLVCLDPFPAQTWAGSDALPQSPKSESSRTILGTFRLGPTSPLSYDVSIAACEAGKCPLQVRLLDNATALATRALDWNATTQGVEKTPIEKTFGVGDPLASEQTLTAWTMGEEESSVSTVAHSVQLTPELSGLLVHQMGGFEHVKRRHYLFVAKGRTLLRVWTGKEGVGPHWSAVEVMGSADGKQQEILYFDGFQYPSGNECDTLEVTRYHWSCAANKLVGQPASGMLAVVVGPYPSAAEARQAQTQATGCLADYWVLPAARFESMGSGRAVLAAVTAKPTLAEEALKAVKTCAPSVTASIRELKKGVNK